MQGRVGFLLLLEIPEKLLAPGLKLLRNAPLSAENRLWDQGVVRKIICDGIPV